MDLYSTRDEEIELTAAQRAEIEDDMVRQARESGFAEQAAQYLTELALETDGFQELSDMGLSSYSITDADGALVQSCDLTLYSAVSRPLLDKDHINISATVNVGSLKHLPTATASAPSCPSSSPPPWRARTAIPSRSI